MVKLWTKLIYRQVAHPNFLDVEIESLWIEWKRPECLGEQGYLGQHGQTQPEAGSCCCQEDVQVQLQLPVEEQVLLQRALEVQVQQVQLQV